jgi:putative alpha-1,2-mannosidase
VQRAELNGRRLDRSWLLHEEVVAGGKLTLHMGPRPSAWACSGDLPQTMTQSVSGLHPDMLVSNN